MITIYYKNIFIHHKRIVFVDIPLLLEQNMNNDFDYVCVAIAPTKTRKKRAMKREGMTEKIFNLIKKNQTSDALRKKYSDYVIDTSGTKNKTYMQLNKMLYDILVLKNERNSSRYWDNWFKF